MSKARLILATLAVGLVASFGACGGGDSSSSGRASRSGARMAGMFQRGAIPVKADTVKVGPISAYILTNTTLEAQRQVDIVARVNGIVKSIRAEEGDEVRRNQVLARLDETELRLNLQRAKAQLENNRRLFERAKEMFAKNLISKEEYDNAQFQYETSKSQYESARVQLEYATIRAPVDGIITARNVEVGDYVTVNRVVYSMADYDTLFARIHIPEKDIVKIHPGQEAKIRVEAFPGRAFRGRVKIISPVVDPTSGTVKVTVEIVRGRSPLLPGMFASVYIVTETHPNAVIIPKKALILESETDRVFVYDNGVARLRDIKVGLSEGDKLEVLEGLKPGELVITVGQEGLRDGAAVRLLGETETEVASKPQGKEEAKQAAPFAAERAPGAGVRGRRGFRFTPEQFARFEQRMLQIPEVKKAFEERAKADPDFRNNMQKKLAFFREMRRKMGMGGRRPGS